MLTNTAKLSDIITELQNLEGINQKADLKSALITKGVNALDTDEVADLINKLNSANLVLNGKRAANGTGTSDNTGAFTVKGLTFLPSIIIIKRTDAINSASIYSNLFTDINNQYVRITGIGSTWYPISQNNGYINSTGFQLQSPANGVNCDWIARE